MPPMLRIDALTVRCLARPPSPPEKIDRPGTVTRNRTSATNASWNAVTNSAVERLLGGLKALP